MGDEEYGFISDRQFWFSYDGSISLFKCYFNDLRYTQKLFSKLDIYFPPELKNAVNRRQAEFLAGRYAAEQAVRQSGFCDGYVPPILVGIDRCPVWPKGIIGSITHNNSQAICAVLPDKKSAYLGIDIENHIPSDTASKIEHFILTQSEKHFLTNQGLPDNLAVTLIFSAKESLFKALYPRIKQYFGFEFAQVQAADLPKGNLTLKVGGDLATKHDIAHEYTCYFTLGNDHVFTAVY